MATRTVDLGKVVGPKGDTGNGILSIAKTSTVGVVDTYTITYTDGTTTTYTVKNGIDGADGVSGPQGPKGNTGATGPQGPQGNPGPNTVSTSTTTALNGVLTGNGSTVGAKSIDTSSLTNDNDHIPTSGVVKSAINTLEDNILNAEVVDDTNVTNTMNGFNSAIETLSTWTGTVLSTMTSHGATGLFYKDSSNVCWAVVVVRSYGIVSAKQNADKTWTIKMIKAF